MHQEWRFVANLSYIYIYIWICIYIYVLRNDLRRLLCQFSIRFSFFLRYKFQLWKPALLGKSDRIDWEEGQSGQRFTWQPVCADVDVPPSSKGIAGWLRKFSGVFLKRNCHVQTMNGGLSIYYLRFMTGIWSKVPDLFPTIWSWSGKAWQRLADNFDERAYNITPCYSVFSEFDIDTAWRCNPDKQTGEVAWKSPVQHGHSLNSGHRKGQPPQQPPVYEVSSCMHHFVADASQLELLDIKWTPWLVDLFAGDLIVYSVTSSTARGGGGSFKNRKPIGEIGCCESRMAEQKHSWCWVVVARTRGVVEGCSCEIFAKWGKLEKHQPILCITTFDIWSELHLIGLKDMLLW